MKKFLVILLRVVLALAVGIAAFVGFCAVRGLPRYDWPTPKLTVEVTPERVARGEKLATMLCAECHANPSTGKLTGRAMKDLPEFLGSIYSKNITQDPDYGIGAWSDGEIARLLRSGIDRTGQYLPPWMPKLRAISDEDLASVIAFLRSDHPMVQATAVKPEGVTELSVLSKVLGNTVYGPLPYPEEPIATPALEDKVEHGRYLVQTLDCWTCHSPDLMALDIEHPEATEGYLSGGSVLRDAQGDEVVAPNLTSDRTGIASWSERDFITTMRTGVRADGRVLRQPMAPRAALTEEELSTMFAYLRSVPKIAHQLPRNPPLVVKTDDPGKRTYYAYGCHGCHGDTGRGVADLRAANEHYPTDEGLTAWIKNAPSIKPGTTMPKWEGVIAEQEFAPLVRYVRSLGRAAPSTLGSL